MKKVKPTIEHEGDVLYWATYETRNFTFDAFGKTEKECLAALKAGIRRHGEEYTGANVNEMLSTVREEFHAVKVKAGLCLRDRDSIK